jgi:dihydroorotate dehydrogenase
VYRLLFGVLSRVPAEPIHEVVFAALTATMRLPFVRAASARLLAPRDPSLTVRALDTTFDGPLGLAAGFDKDGRGPDALAALGFAFVEVGTVTPEPQPGNPKPRVFRLKKDRALVNRMGFPSQGAAAVRERLARRSGPAVVAINVGKNKSTSEADAAADFARAARELAPFARFCVVNVSSPNTPGLRDLQRPAALREVMDRVRAGLDEGSPSRRVPLLVKIAPDLDDAEVDRIATLVTEAGLDGVVAVNTTVARSGLDSTAAEIEGVGAGGLSGPPLRKRARDVLVRLRRALGPGPILVSVGGVATVEDAWERITHGATLLELYTGFIYEGPLVAKRIHDGLAEKLREHGYASIQEAVGVAVDTSFHEDASPTHA